MAEKNIEEEIEKERVFKKVTNKIGDFWKEHSDIRGLRPVRELKFVNNDVGIKTLGDAILFIYSKKSLPDENYALDSESKNIIQEPKWLNTDSLKVEDGKLFTEKSMNSFFEREKLYNGALKLGDGKKFSLDTIGQMVNLLYKPVEGFKELTQFFEKSGFSLDGLVYDSDTNGFFIKGPQVDPNCTVVRLYIDLDTKVGEKYNPKSIVSVNFPENHKGALALPKEKRDEYKVPDVTPLKKKDGIGAENVSINSETMPGVVKLVADSIAGISKTVKYEQEAKHKTHADKMAARKADIKK